MTEKKRNRFYKNKIFFPYKNQENKIKIKLQSFYENALA